MSVCATCGGPYVLIGDECGECLLTTYVPLPVAPVPVHEPVVAPDGSSPKYLAGWEQARRRLSSLAGGAAAARVPYTGPSGPVSRSW